jgi:hypothetical protein
MGFCDASVTIITDARRLLRYPPPELVRVSHVSRGTAVCSHRYWDRPSSLSRDLVVGTPDHRWDEFILIGVTQVTLGRNATIRTAAITCVAESNQPPPTRLRRSKRRLRHNRERSRLPSPSLVNNLVHSAMPITKIVFHTMPRAASRRRGLPK